MESKSRMAAIKIVPTYQHFLGNLYMKEDAWKKCERYGFLFRNSSGDRDIAEMHG